jgi:hypothetical protein
MTELPYDNVCYENSRSGRHIYQALFCGGTTSPPPQVSLTRWRCWVAYCRSAMFYELRVNPIFSAKRTTMRRSGSVLHEGAANCVAVINLMRALVEPEQNKTIELLLLKLTGFLSDCPASVLPSCLPTRHPIRRSSIFPARH